LFNSQGSSELDIQSSTRTVRHNDTASSSSQPQASSSSGKRILVVHFSSVVEQK